MISRWVCASLQLPRTFPQSDLLLYSAVLALTSDARTPRCAASDLQRALPPSPRMPSPSSTINGTVILLDTPELIAAAARMAAVTGIPPVALEEIWETSTCVRDIRLRKDVCDAIMAWAKIERGSDLFVAGKFNKSSRGRTWTCFSLLVQLSATLAAYQAFNTNILFHPCDLQAAAYFPTALRSYGATSNLRKAISPASSSGAFRRVSRILGHIDGADYPPRQHLLRYRVWWDDPDHINQLDELEDARAAYDKAARDVAERLDEIRVCNIMGAGFITRPPEGFQWADGVDLQRLVVDETIPLPSPSIVRIMSSQVRWDGQTSKKRNDDIEAGKLRKQLLDQTNRYYIGPSSGYYFPCIA